MKGRSDSFTDEGECKMKRRINPVCGIIAVLCIATMFVPSIMARESEFGGYAHFVSPAVFLMKRATSGFYSSEPIWKIFALLLLANIALLAVWCVLSFGKTEKIGKKGIAAAIVHLITVALMTEISLDLERSPFNAGIIVSVVLAIVAILYFTYNYQLNKNLEIISSVPVAKGNNVYYQDFQYSQRLEKSL